MPTRRHLLALLLALSCLALTSWPTHAAPKPQTLAPAVASYTMRASLDAAAKLVHGEGTIEYRNPSADTLAELWFHLYLNAFSSRETTWLREAGEARSERSFDPNAPGGITVERLRVASGGADLLPAAEVNETLMRVPLPAPLGPGQTVRLDVTWTSRLPKAVARTGFVSDYFLVGQWYPKLSVYDRGHWNNQQFHANAEFFADFGRYDVTLTVPAGMTLGATGLPRDQPAPGGATGDQTRRYVAEDVTDFVWTACACLRERVERAGEVEIVTLVPTGQEALEPRLRWATEQALRFFGEWWGRYPRPRLTVVLPPADAGATAGMEYPMFVTSEALAGIGDNPAIHFLEYVTIHEVGHQWWPMVVQTNEMEEPWLDEGFTEFAGVRLMNHLWPPDRSLVDLPFARLGTQALHRATYTANPHQIRVYGAAWELKDYATSAYSKPALLLATLEQQLGAARFLDVMRVYFQRWGFRHPRTEDFIAVANEVSGQELTAFFQQYVYGTQVLDYRAGPIRTEPQGVGWLTTADVQRLGDGTLPVEVVTTFADGSSQRAAWNGEPARFETAYPGSEPGVRLAVNGGEPIPLEVDQLDNVAEVEPTARLGRFFVALLPAVQAVLQLVGHFG